jgi:hypothetical protein
MGKGLAKRLVYQMSKYLLEKGYQKGYSSIINIISLNLFSKLGGLVLSKNIYQRQYEGGEFPMDMHLL